MKRFTKGESRVRTALFRERLDGWIAEDNLVRAVHPFVDALELAKLGLEDAEPCSTAHSG